MGGDKVTNNTEMQALADALWEYFQEKVERMTSSNVWYFRAQVTRSASGGKITVRRPFDTDIALPYVSSMASAAVVLGSSLTNAVIIGDGTLSNL